jgi:hypothetical protein
MEWIPINYNLFIINFLYFSFAFPKQIKFTSQNLYFLKITVLRVADPPELASLHSYKAIRGPGSSVGIATRYELDGPEIESRFGRDFPHPSRPDLGPTQPLYNAYRAFPGGKTAGKWRWSPTPSSAEVQKRVGLYPYSPSGPSWPVL